MDTTAADTFDVIVIGGGPGGSSAANYLVRGGCRVLLLEKEIFPRFHIGESLLPYNQPLWEEMGVMEELRQAGFPRKVGAQFVLGNGSMRTRFRFSEGRFTRQPEAIQVERATFDHILLKAARRDGADVREGWTVSRFQTAAESVTVEAKDAQGQRHSFHARFLVDASGRANLTGNQEGLRVVHPRLKKIAVFGHFEGVKLDADEAAGDTVIIRLEDKWFWVIPVGAGKTSVGLVMDQSEFQASPARPADIFWRWVKASPPMRERLAKAEARTDIQVTGDFSYHNRRLVGPRLLRVGDAAGFMDPIFSAGVYLAMWSGKLAAQAILDALARKQSGVRQLKNYERRFRRGMEFYWNMVNHFYTTPFIEIFMNPRENVSLPAAVNAVLAGELEGRWPVRWRLWVFFALVRLQHWFPLVPRISYAVPETPAETKVAAAPTP